MSSPPDNDDRRVLGHKEARDEPETHRYTALLRSYSPQVCKRPLDDLNHPESGIDLRLML